MVDFLNEVIYANNGYIIVSCNGCFSLKHNEKFINVHVQYHLFDNLEYLEWKAKRKT